MKNISKILLFSILCNVVYANKLVDLIATQTGQKISMIKEQTLSQDPNLKFVVLKDEVSGFKVSVITNKQETIIIPLSTFFTSSEKDRTTIINEIASVNNFNMTFKTQSAVKAAIASLPKDYIIELKGKNHKKVFYIISDPLCPHCQVELNNIEKRLEEGDVKMIPVGMMGEEAAKKAAEIYHSAKQLKTDSEKIAMLKKIYNKDYKAKNFDTKEVQEVTRALIGEGKVEGTPYIIEEDR